MPRSPPLLSQHPPSCRCVLCWLVSFLLNMHVAEGAVASCVEPRFLFEHMTAVLGQEFIPKKQADAHAFLCRLLESCCLASLLGTDVEVGDPARRDETTPVHAVLGGYFCNR